jgi:hypothetical protein
MALLSGAPAMFYNHIKANSSAESTSPDSHPEARKIVPFSDKVKLFHFERSLII